jgi:amidase
LAELIRTRKVSSEEVVKAHLARIEAVNPRINAVVTLAAERALREAREADAALARGKRKGPLHGVPMTIKDSFDTEGVRSTAGTKGREHYVPKVDATAVARLRQAGAILLGKTNTPELTMSFETANAIFGQTRNPYNTAMTPGGSSGGAAAIIAAGGSPLDVGTDTGGSIRVPAHFCGIAGIKPTWGRIPRTGHIISFGSGMADSVTHVGPMARFVDDLTLLLPILAGADGSDPSVVPMPLLSVDAVKIPKLRVMFHADNGLCAPSAETARAVRAAVDYIARAGARVDERTMEPLKAGVKRWEPLVADLADASRALLAECGTATPSPEIAWINTTKPFSAADVSRAMRRWQQFRAEMHRFFFGYDAIICPANAFGSLPLHEVTKAAEASAYTYTEVFNSTGWPAAVVRVGTSEAGTPIGVQIVAQPWREDVALALAKRLETEFGGWRPPAL